MEEIKIEKGILMPSKRGEDWNNLVGTLSKMKVGDSFLASVPLANAFRSVAPRKGMRVSGRKQPDGRIRVWRIK